MFNLQRYLKHLQYKRISAYFLPGDMMVITLGVVVVFCLFQMLWSTEHATKVQIRLADKIYATYSLKLQREIHVPGKLGDTVIDIANGKARFAKSPCQGQYCVHQAWLSLAGQAAICLPNQVSLELLGDNKPYDSLNY
jgi:hypothetical protein